MNQNFRQYRDCEDEASRRYVGRPQQHLQDSQYTTPMKDVTDESLATTGVMTLSLTRSHLLSFDELEWNWIRPCTSPITRTTKTPKLIISEVTIAAGFHGRDFLG